MAIHLTDRRPERVLRRHFGYSGFRPGQRELVDAVLAGRDAIGVLPTGGGKSVCYQVPALILPGLTIVVCPLVSLIEDQVRRAGESGIRGRALHSGMDRGELRRTEHDLRQGTVRLLLLAPERFSNPNFRRLLPDLEVSLFTVDEAHCISMWGHDFRPAYRTLGELRPVLQGAPVLALTATATERVRVDIERSLKLREPERVVGSFDRPNLLWAVRRIEVLHERERATRELLTRFDRARLVYASTRRRVERIRSSLARAGIPAEAYHAGLPPEERSAVQNRFLSGDHPVVVATSAFGMGIDRSDVRLVVHDQLPGSLEDYYQEAGRAGRDGDPALCIAFFLPEDGRVYRRFLDQTHPPIRSLDAWCKLRRQRGVMLRLARRRSEKAKLLGISRYAKSRGCRRRVLLEWFGERSAGGKCPGCDQCLGWAGLLKRAACR